MTGPDQQSLQEQEIRRALAPYVFDGTEVLARIMTLITSHSRPSDLAAPIRAILERQYGDTVPVDVVVAYLGLDGGSEP
jgi:hypothetical protein